MLKSLAKLTNNGYIAYQTCVWAMRLAMLAPDIIESVIRGDYPANISVNSTRKSVPDLWKDQVTELMK